MYGHTSKEGKSDKLLPHYLKEATLNHGPNEPGHALC